MSNWKKITLLLVVCLLSFGLFATHNRSGEITYRHIQGYTYEFTVTTCTKTSSEADRDELELFWGDGTLDTIPRVDIEFYTTFDSQKNTYRFTHTYAGPGVYTISMEDPNRNAGVINIVSSVDKPFCIKTELVISPFLGNNNNSLLLEDCPCPELACVGQKWCYNTGAYDPDGDSLAYELIPCKGENCLDMDIPSVYQYPHEIAGGTLIIDPLTGTLCWDSPQFQGEYNIAIKISEFRNGVYIGSVIRDMQITVSTCNNDAPIIQQIQDTCIEANTILNQSFQATDVNNDLIDFTAVGEVFNDPTDPAVFGPINGNGLSTGTFNWVPGCDDVREAPYNVVFTAEDNDLPVPLKDIFVWRITVKTPEVDGLMVAQIGGDFELNWNPSECANIDHYNIYRATDSLEFDANCCHNGSALDFGYELLAETNDTNFIDSVNLNVGIKYCYVVTAVLPNGSESCPNDIVCAELDFAIPVMTRVSIIDTDAITGTDSVMWSRPKELDLVAFSGPYEYRVYHSEGFDNPSTLVFTSPSNPVLADLDTVFVHTNINTQDTAHTYEVELYSNASLVGRSTSASSVFLSGMASDNEAQLSWQYDVPWNVDSTLIYRETSPGSGIFNFIGVSYTNDFVDTGLVNGTEYCYKVATVGAYSIPNIHAPLINYSQITCVTPLDNVAPCPPVLTGSNDCDLSELTLVWNNPNNSCADDVTRYNIYYAEESGGVTSLIATLNLNTDTSIVLSSDTLLPGCFYVTALDSIQYNNESAFSNEVCLEYCDPLYELPNVFTPNNDGANDLYHPILPIKYVERVNFYVKNRWGNEVFNTTDPMINWDGTDLESGKPLVAGVYFYQCEVFFKTLSGEDSITLRGFITLKRKE